MSSRAKPPSDPPNAALDLESHLARLEPPVLIVSTVVGRGMFTLGEALRERLAPERFAGHLALEDYLPAAAVAEDLKRYQFISCRIPMLLYLVYKLPIFYYRKYRREARGPGANLSGLEAAIAGRNPGTVVCVSHRPGFWVSCVKRRTAARFDLWGLLGEYGNTLGWRYIFWEQMNGFYSPLDRHELTYDFPASLEFVRIELPARRAYSLLASQPGEPRHVLLVCGYWGQGPIRRVLEQLLAVDPALSITVICGENASVQRRIQRAFGAHPNLRIHGVVPSLEPHLAACSCVITKPGISTLLEAHAARRKLFLLPGMPVAEDNNARYALRHFGAEWFTPDAFRAWRRAPENRRRTD